MNQSNQWTDRTAAFTFFFFFVKSILMRTQVVSAFDDMLVAKRMIREIRLLRQFDHDNIIRIVDMLPPPSVEKFKDVYMVLDRMDTVRACLACAGRWSGKGWGGAEGGHSHVVSVYLP